MLCEFHVRAIFFCTPPNPTCASTNYDIPSRSLATSTPPPEQRASELIEKLPSSPGLLTKTGSAILGTGLVATAISQELYVVNEESIILIASIMFFTYLGKVRLPLDVSMCGPSVLTDVSG